MPVETFHTLIAKNKRNTSFLIVGFMIHNVTEGLGIAAPAADARASLPWTRLAALALIAGAPAIPGAWIGGFVANLAQITSAPARRREMSGPGLLDLVGAIGAVGPS